MKKRLLTMALISTMILAVTACGKEAEEENREQRTEKEGKVISSGTIDMDELLGKSDEKEEETEEAYATSHKEEIEEEEKHFECFPEVAAAPFESGMMQIDDVVLTIGNTVGEAMEAFANSECDYEYEYVEDAIISKYNGMPYSIEINKNDDLYIILGVYNYDRENTCDLKDCFIDYVSFYNGAEENAYYAGNIKAGDSYDELIETFSGYEETANSSNSVKEELVIAYRVVLDSKLKEYDDPNRHIKLIFDTNSRLLKEWDVVYYLR